MADVMVKKAGADGAAFILSGHAPSTTEESPLMVLTVFANHLPDAICEAAVEAIDRVTRPLTGRATAIRSIRESDLRGVTLQLLLANAADDPRLDNAERVAQAIAAYVAGAPRAGRPQRNELPGPTKARATELIELTQRHLAALQARRKDVSTNSPGSAAEALSELSDVLGSQLVAYIAGLRTTRLIRMWSEGAASPPEGVRDRVRIALFVARMIAEHEPRGTVQAWFMGLNPNLNDRSPATVLRDDPVLESAGAIASAARAFLAS
ncbi:hypothetical protein [Salinibacterium sp. ZJ450]|uniref:hypothetical protein n=1 Tax=Salinibacterium sp. ZJ450 TaxID=2708338 RepID=UPI00141F05F1|nr:hypothetical protein [Salinibacterium sp. ZJ450]